MKNKRIKNSLILMLILLVSIASYFGYKHIQLTNNTSLEVEATRLGKQALIAQKIESEVNSELQVYLDPFDIAPLSALLTFETDEALPVTITLKGMHNSPDLSWDYDAALKHQLPIYGLYADSTNEVIISYGDVNTSLSIQTAPLPDGLSNNITNIHLNEVYRSQLESNFYFMTPASVGYTSAYDINGNVRWYLTEQLVWEIRTLNNGNLILSNDKIINPPYYQTGMYEMSMLGYVYNEYILPGGYHHDVSELPNGNLIVASNDFETFTVEDVIVEIDRNTGEIVKSIDLKNILDTESGKSENWVDLDWFHNNSVWYDEKTNSLTLSGRHQDIVVNLDYDSLKINYIIGEKESFSDDMLPYFLEPIGDLEFPYSQHAAKILPDGNVFIFDNGNNRSKDPSQYLAAENNYSRGVIYKIDQDKRTIEQVYEYGKERGSDYYSPYISDVDYLDNNHYLVHSGGHAKNNMNVLNVPPGLTEFTDLASYTSEVLNDELIFEIQTNQNYYRAEKMAIYNSHQNFEFKPSLSLGSLSSSFAYESGFGLLDATFDEDVLDALNLNIHQEHNRLVISGDFEKEDFVNVILYKNLQYKRYNVRISERPYTAMCIVIFDNETQQVNQYINDDDELSGKYTILLEINHKIYNLKTNAIFK